MRAGPGGHLEEAFKERKLRLGPANLHTLVTMCDLADTYRMLDMLDRAVPLSEECLKLHRANMRPGHLNTMHALSSLAAAYLAAGTPEPTVRLADEMLLEI